MLLAGVYLVYTGYQLCKDVLTGVEGASVGFLAAGVAFLVIGGVIPVSYTHLDVYKRQVYSISA